MKYLLIIFFFYCIAFFSCKNSQNSNSEFENNEITDSWDLISDSKDHRDYIRFLNDFPDSEYFDTAITRYIKFKKIFCDTVLPPAWHCTRNCIKIEADSIGNILFENDSLDLINLKTAVLNQLINPNDDHYLPEKVEIVDDTGAKRMISKGFIYVITRLKNPSSLKNIVIELKKAIEEYKGYLSKKWYAKTINKLSKPELKNIESVIRTKYFFDKFDFYPIEILDKLEEPSI